MWMRDEGMKGGSVREEGGEIRDAVMGQRQLKAGRLEGTMGVETMDGGDASVVGTVVL